MCSDRFPRNGSLQGLKVIVPSTWALAALTLAAFCLFQCYHIAAWRVEVILAVMVGGLCIYLTWGFRAKHITSVTGDASGSSTGNPIGAKSIAIPTPPPTTTPPSARGPLAVTASASASSNGFSSSPILSHASEPSAPSFEEGPSAAHRGSTAAELMEDITAAVDAAEQEAGNNLAEAKEKLLALKTAKAPVAEKVGLMQDVLMKVISAWEEVEQCFRDDLKRKFRNLARRVRQWQAATASLELRVTALEHAVTEYQREKRSMFLGECAFSFAKLLQEHTFRGDDQLEKKHPPLYVTKIISKGDAKPRQMAKV
ncbi:g1560 [Coccomyxa elongata]